MSGSSSPSTASTAPTIYQLSSLPPPSTLSEASIDTDLLKPPGMGKPRGYNNHKNSLAKTYPLKNYFYLQIDHIRFVKSLRLLHNRLRKA